MKQHFRTMIVWFILITYAFLPGCGNTPSTLPGSSPTQVASPTPKPCTDKYIEAFTTYESTAGICTVYDVDSEIYLYTKQDLNTRLYPASTTKLFTAWVALQYLSPEKVILVGDELDRVAPDASIAYLQKGYTLSVSSLIEGMLLPSGNDAAYVIACHAGRAIARNDRLDTNAAIAAFMDEMNRQTALQGLHDTHFVSPDGYHDPDHYTTVEDLIQIAKIALNDEVIAQYVQVAKEEITFSDGNSVLWENTNLLLHADSPYFLKDAVGLKTGYTKAAGYVLLSAIRNPHTASLMIMLVAQCPTPESRFAETISLYNVLKSVEID